jgi:hypothetical protein
MESIVAKTNTVSVPPGDRVLRLAAQIIGVAVVFASLFVTAAPNGVAIAACGVSVVFSVAAPPRERALYVQLCAAAAALTGAIVLMAYSPPSSGVVPSHLEQRADAPRATEATPATAPAVDNRSAPLGSGGAATTTAASSDSPAKEDSSTNESSRPDGRSKPSVSIGGVTFGDLGDGDPFASVDLTEREAKELSRLYSEFWAGQAELQRATKSGQMSVVEYQRQLKNLGDEINVELDDLLGRERVRVLSDEMALYLQRMMQDPAKAAATMQGLEGSDLLKSLEHLEKEPRVP